MDLESERFPWQVLEPGVHSVDAVSEGGVALRGHRHVDGTRGASHHLARGDRFHAAASTLVFFWQTFSEILMHPKIVNSIAKPIS